MRNLPTLRLQKSLLNTENKPMSQASDLEEKLDAQLQEVGLPPYVRQFHFAPGRRYASDFAWPDYRLIVEVEGGTFNGGRHVTGAGFHNDCMKYALAFLEGYWVLRVDAAMVKDGTARAYIRDWFLRQGWTEEDGLGG